MWDEIVLSILQNKSFHGNNLQHENLALSCNRITLFYINLVLAIFNYFSIWCKCKEIVSSLIAIISESSWHITSELISITTCNSSSYISQGCLEWGGGCKSSSNLWSERNFFKSLSCGTFFYHISFLNNNTINQMNLICPVWIWKKKLNSTFDKYIKLSFNNVGKWISWFYNN